MINIEEHQSPTQGNWIIGVLTGIFLIALPLIGEIFMLIVMRKVDDYEYMVAMVIGDIIVLTAAIAVKILSENFLKRIIEK